jgi:hypothetical protein
MIGQSDENEFKQAGAVSVFGGKEAIPDLDFLPSLAGIQAKFKQPATQDWWIPRTSRWENETFLCRHN